MNSMIKQSLVEWNKRYDNFAKLQHIYIALIVILTFVAGLLSLLDIVIINTVLEVIKLIAITLFVNLLTMILVKSFVVDKIKKIKISKK
ncbi:hypothetical protein CR956_00225 [Candidatus Saccharibacteria bacterium]|nr:MAG: hypothetical protein CR956_00225 [Candidatus Saccharibacteria bacterium]